MTAIGEGSVATIHYTLSNDEGKVLDTSRGGEPLAFLAGAGNIVTGLENALIGKKVGDTVQVVVPPEDGYGEVTGDGPQAVPKREFGKHASDLREGMPLRLQASDGSPVVVWIHEIRGSRVFIDTNHPLAGKTLHFDVEVLDLREASAEEVAHGHVHGPGGHHH